MPLKDTYSIHELVLIMLALYKFYKILMRWGTTLYLRAFLALPGPKFSSQHLQMAAYKVSELLVSRF